MKDDDLLRALADLARAEDEELDDPRWERLARTELDERERAELAAGAGGSEVAERALVAFEPLDAAAKDRIEAAIFGVLAPAAPVRDVAKFEVAVGRRVVVGGAGPASVRRSPRDLATREGPASTRTPAPSSRRRVAFTTLLLAAALGAGAMVIGGRAPALPRYAMEIVGGDQEVRGAPVTSTLTPHVGVGSRIEIKLRPDTRSDAPMAARAFLARDGHVRPWEVPIEVGEGGAARVTGTRDTLFGGVEDGAWEIVFAVGPAETLPRADAVEAVIRGDRAAEGFRLLRRDVILGAVRAPGASSGTGKP